MTVQVMEKGGMYRATYSGITDIRKSFVANKVYMLLNDKVACSGVENDGIYYDVFDEDMVRITIDLDRYMLMIIQEKGERIGGWVGVSYCDYKNI